MPFWNLFYHIVWSTKNRAPLLTGEIETLAYGYLRSKAVGLGATVFALNGNADHVHMVVSIPPKISIARFIGQIKAVASTKLNKSGKGTLFWQEEYGIFSLDKKHLPTCIDYVEHQKRHHADDTLRSALEPIERE